MSRFVILIAFFLLLLTSVGSAESTDVSSYQETICRQNCASPAVLNNAFVMAGEVFKLDAVLLKAVARTESGFNIMARNRQSFGLMQVNLKYHRDKFKGVSVYNPHANIFAGAQILADCFKAKKGNIRKALLCYNGGGNKKYPTLVLKHYQEIKERI